MYKEGKKEVMLHENLGIDEPELNITAFLTSTNTRIGTLVFTNLSYA